VFHLYLVSSGITTNEQLKQAFPNGSPWSRGCVGNWVEMCRGKRRVETWHRREKVNNATNATQQQERHVQPTRRHQPEPDLSSYSYHIAHRTARPTSPPAPHVEFAPISSSSPLGITSASKQTLPLDEQKTSQLLSAVSGDDRGIVIDTSGYNPSYQRGPRLDVTVDRGQVRQEEEKRAA